MDCESWREHASALLDGEPAGAPVAVLESHMDECADCRRWREGAHEVTRRFRLAAAEDAPSPQHALQAVRAASGSARRWSAVGFVRAGLIVVAAAQLAVAAPALLLGSDHGAPIHVAHEMGSFDLALAAGFLVAAWRPSRARGMQGLVGVAALMLVATALLDLFAARTSIGDEAPHLLIVAGWLLLRRLTSLTPAQVDAAPSFRWASLRSRRAALSAAPGAAPKPATDTAEPAPGTARPAPAAGASNPAVPMAPGHDTASEPRRAREALG